MKYLIVQDWCSTRGNHAGMVHMCKLLCARYPTEYKMVVVEEPKYCYHGKNVFSTFYCRILSWVKKHIVFPLDIKKSCKQVLSELNESDEVFLLEYLFPNVNQYVIARLLRNEKKSVRIYALSHLTPKFMSENAMPSSTIKKWSLPIDVMLTLGSSLSGYLVKCGVDSLKISTGFHYVDGDYYRKMNEGYAESVMTIIVIGSMMRNENMTAEIIRRTPFVKWIVCLGRKKNTFNFTNNVEVLGYVSEDTLRLKMMQSDASLSVMDDTIGSNVITTSMAMGLVNIASDVGSIRDYCDESNSILCKNDVESFVDNIHILAESRDLQEKLKKNAVERSKSFSIEKVHEWFSKLRDMT